MTSFDRIIADNPDLQFMPGESYVWSPEKNTVYYPEDDKLAVSLLHEIGHARAGHTSYRLDIELVKMEADAWSLAGSLSEKYDIDIDQEHVDDCMDTYRDWLLSRAKCPDCDIAGIQSAATMHYTCINCAQSWKVPAESQCIVRRRVIESK